MDFVQVGEIVNTHGIKGELRIVSKFKYKEKIFKKEFPIYIGKVKEKMIINSYRKHKIFDMLLFSGITSINEVLVFKGELIYINRADLKEDMILNEDLIDFEVLYNGNFIGYIKEILNNNAHDILIIKQDKKSHLIPYVDEFIEEVDLKNKTIKIKEMEGLIDEN